MLQNQSSIGGYSDRELTYYCFNCVYGNLLHLSVSMCLMIGQFSMLYFTVWSTKFKSLFELNPEIK